MLTSFTVENFKSYKKATLPLSELTVLIGQLDVREAAAGLPEEAPEALEESEREDEEAVGEEEGIE